MLYLSAKILLLATVGTAVRLFVSVLQTPPSSDATGLAALVVQIGLSGIFLWLFMQERAQRVKRDDQMIEFTSTLSLIILNATKALEGYDRNVHETLRKIAELPDRADIDIATRRMEQIADALAKALEQMAARRRDTDG